jgi:hypothetical protein
MEIDLRTYITSYIWTPGYYITNIIGNVQGCETRFYRSSWGTTEYRDFCFGIHFVEHFNMIAFEIVPRLPQAIQYIFVRPFLTFPASDPDIRSLRVRVFLFAINAATLIPSTSLSSDVSSAKFLFPDDFCFFLALHKFEDHFFKVDLRTHVLSNLHFCDFQLFFVR